MLRDSHSRPVGRTISITSRIAWPPGLSGLLSTRISMGATGRLSSAGWRATRPPASLEPGVASVAARAEAGAPSWPGPSNRLPMHSSPPRPASGTGYSGMPRSRTRSGPKSASAP
jgi:hypothetical protein